MNDICCFDRGTACGALQGEKNCNGCHFFKTAEQYLEDYEKAKRILDAKGLESYRTEDNIITVRKKRI